MMGSACPFAILIQSGNMQMFHLVTAYVYSDPIRVHVTVTESNLTSLISEVFVGTSL